MWPFDCFKKRKGDDMKTNAKKESFVRSNSPVSLESLFKKSFSFHVERYEMWQMGRCISSDSLSFNLHFVADSTKLFVEIPNSSRFNMHDSASFFYAESIVLRDRIQYVNAPGASKDSARPIILHIFVKERRIDYVRFAMSFPDRIVEFYGFEIVSASSTPVDNNSELLNIGQSKNYKLSCLASLFHVAICDGNLSRVEVDALTTFIQREGLSDDDLMSVIDNPRSFPFINPNDVGLQARHLEDAVTIAMVDGEFTPEEYALCQQIAIKLGLKPEYVDLIRRGLNEKIGADI